MSPINPTTRPETIESTLFGGSAEFCQDLLSKLKVSSTDPAAVITLLGNHWGLTNNQTPAVMAVIEHNFATSAITGSHWVEVGKNVTASAAHLQQDDDQDLRVRFDMPRLE